jgi:hypothetical protein
MRGLVNLAIVLLGDAPPDVSYRPRLERLVVRRAADARCRTLFSRGTALGTT